MPKRSRGPLFLAIAGVVALFVSGGWWGYLRFGPREAPEDAAPKPPPCDMSRYQEQLRADATELGVEVPDYTTLTAPLNGGVELDAARVLSPVSGAVAQEPAADAGDAEGKKKGKAPKGKKVARAAKGKAQKAGKADKTAKAKKAPAPTLAGGSLLTEHLQLRLELESLPLRGSLSPHLVLAITNQAQVPVAYRVVTEPPAGVSCEGMHRLPYNAIVLYPGETARRVECVAPEPGKKGGPSLKVKRVEAYEVTALSSRYLRRLPVVDAPAFDMRVAEAHRGEPLPLCSRDFEPVLGKLGAQGFAVMVEFFSRHNCQRYRLPPTYKPGASAPVCAGLRKDERAPVAPPPPSLQPVYISAALGVALLALAFALLPRRKRRAVRSQAAVVELKEEAANLNDAYFR